MDFEKMLYEICSKDENILPKAIANFMFREIIEDAHCKYRISQEDVKNMCKQAVNRAAILETALNDKELSKALTLYGYSTSNWDAPDQTIVDMGLSKLKQSAAAIK